MFGGNAGHGRRDLTVDQTPPRQPPTLLRYGNSAREFDKIRNYAVMRVALFLAKRHKRGLVWFAQVFGSRGELGLISLNGIVVAARPNRPWRAPVERSR